VPQAGPRHAGLRALRRRASTRSAVFHRGRRRARPRQSTAASGAVEAALRSSVLTEPRSREVAIPASTAPSRSADAYASARDRLANHRRAQMGPGVGRRSRETR
jgi:hypothetical protein